MICEGWDVTGTPRAVEFGKTITGVEGRESAPDIRIAPAWVDIQVNGYAGVDYNDPKAPHEEIARSIRVLHSTGVARFLPTIITGSPENMTGALANIAAARESVPEGVSIEGFHVEGPHISPDDGPRGAHPRRWVRPPDVDEFQRWQEAARGLIRLVTLSPEWPQATRYIEALVDRGVVASIGHTKAEAAQIADAVRAGATFSTHLGNGAHAVLRRHPNYIWEQLAEDRLMAGFIVDGIHLPQSFLRVALRAKGVERSVLVTDASGPAGCKPGRYRLGEQEVDLTEDERVVLAGQERLAGSALRMDRGIENLVKLGGLSLADAVRMATVNPARAVGVAGRQAGLEPGERADLVLFRWDPERGAVELAATYVDGEQVYSAASSSVVV